MVRALLKAVERHYRTHVLVLGGALARGGGVAIIQRFGGALHLNLHVHALVLDGVYARDPDGRVRFQAAPAVTAADVADVLAAVIPAVGRVLARRGLAETDDHDPDPFADARRCWPD